MRCLACNKILTDVESRHKFSNKEHSDTCRNCRTLGYQQFGYNDLFGSTHGDPIGILLTTAMQDYQG